MRQRAIWVPDEDERAAAVELAAFAGLDLRVALAAVRRAVRYRVAVGRGRAGWSVHRYPGEGLLMLTVDAPQGGGSAGTP